MNKMYIFLLTKCWIY